jgi:hypothetical protein
MLYFPGKLKHCYNLAEPLAFFSFKQMFVSFHLNFILDTCTIWASLIPAFDVPMTGIRDILRDAPAGQLGRLYLGLKISPYVDEQEGFAVTQQPTAEEEVPERDSTNDNENDASDKDSSEKATSDKDVERNAADKPSHPQPKPEPSAVEWSGPTDADNPQNWSTVKKTFVFAQICLLTFASQCDPSPIAPNAYSEPHQ